MVQTVKHITNEDDSYEQHGSISKGKILQLIKEEDITLKSSFESSLNKQATYQRATRVFNSSEAGEKEIHHVIIVPSLTDDSDIVQAIILAHEIGHYFVYKNTNKFKISLLSAGFKLTTYINEKLAWKKAKQILKSEGVISEDGDILQRKAYQEFIQVERKCLKSYGHPLLSYSRGITNAANKSIRLLLFSYLFIAILFVFENNKIPIPFAHEIYNISLNHFYSYVLNLFLFLVLTLIIKRAFSFLLKWQVT